MSDSVSLYIFEVAQGDSNYEINYHYYTNELIIKDKFVAHRCSSWIDAVNQLNRDLTRIGFPEYYIDSFQEKANL